MLNREICPTPTDFVKSTEKREYMAGKIFVTGDMHGSAGAYRLQNHVYGGRLDEDDVVLVAGDWGMPFIAPKIEDEGLDQMALLPFKIAFIDGNHENFPLLRAYPEKEHFGGPVGVLRPNIFHLKKRGHVYYINGKSFWCFGGAASHDKECRQKGVSWWPEEEANEEEMEYGVEQLRKYEYVDFMLSHDCPFSLCEFNPRLFRSHDVKPNAVNRYLDKAAKRGKAELWIFGHHHLDRDIAGIDPYPNQKFRAIYRDIVRLV